VVADALSRRSHVSRLVVESMPFELCEEFDKLSLRIIANTKAIEMEVGSSLLQGFKRLSATSRKRSHLAFRKVMKEYYSTKEGSVCLTSKS
jgi:hypothetical protein